MNSKVAYMQPYYSQVVKNIYQFNLVIVCEGESEWEEKQRIVFYIILLCSLYYFIELYIKKKFGMQGEL